MNEKKPSIASVIAKRNYEKNDIYTYVFDDENLKHYGTKRHSGRYPYGSGEDPYQHERAFLGRLQKLRKSGWKETAENIKKEFGENTTLDDYRNEKMYANYITRLDDVNAVKAMKSDGLSNVEIGKKLNMNESSVRSLLNSEREERMKQAADLAVFLKKQVDEKGMIDVGEGVDLEMGVSKEKMKQALWILEKKEGYNVYSGRVQQVTNKNGMTTQKVLTKPEYQHKDIFDLERVKTINDYTCRQDAEGKDIFTNKMVYPASMDSKRLQINYATEDGKGGALKDGVIELRRGVEDLSLGGAAYSQVRILVDGTHYLKGMAVYSDDLPDGVDVRFNTNKTSDKSMTEVLKPIKKNDPVNPFGSAIAAKGQSVYFDKDGKEHLSLINKRADEGDWSEWKDKLPSQMLSKQKPALAKQQLNLAIQSKKNEYEDIMAIDNPTIRKHFLNKFADECDSAAVHLAAAALPGQRYSVILPSTTLGDHEVFAPNYENGTKLALIRYPHGGTFEIPILTVNNKNKECINMVGKDKSDAVCITKNVADRLSGADFDGDTVMTIPTHNPGSNIRITATKELEGLKGFDPKLEYGTETKYDANGNEHYYRNGMEIQPMRNTQTEMGKISNLITDMTLLGANQDELARAVRHSMVVIDAEKHHLDYKKSEIDNNIAGLKKAYQIKVRPDGEYSVGKGASTIISRAKGQATVEKRRGTPIVNIKGSKYYDPSKPEGTYIYKAAKDLYYPERSKDKKTNIVTLRDLNGKKITYDATNAEERKKYEPIVKKDDKGNILYSTDEKGRVYFTNADGTIKYRTKTRTQKSTNMDEVDDARDLISPARHQMEIIYADFANEMKKMANESRKEAFFTKNSLYSSESKKLYSEEVKSLDAKLKTAKLNASREREAQRRANVEVQKYKKESEKMGINLKESDIKKKSQQAIENSRWEVGSIKRSDRNIFISDREWEAIQKGAIPETKLKDILNNSDVDSLRERATPKSYKNTMTTSKVSIMKNMKANGYSLQEIAKRIGVSPSTVSAILKE